MTTKTTWLQDGRMLTGLVWIFLIFLGSWSNHMSTGQSAAPSCYTLCEDEFQFNNSDCGQVVTSDCQHDQQKVVSKVQNDADKPPLIQFVEIYRTPGENDKFSFRFSWVGPANDAENGSRIGYKVQVEKKLGNDPRCLAFDFVHSTVQPQPSFHDCFPSVKNGEVLNITLTQTTPVSSVQYIMKCPVNLSHAIDPPSILKWKTIVGVAVLPASSSLFVVFQPAPPSLNISSYVISLMDSDSEVLINYRNVAQGVSTITFIRPDTGKRFYARVQPIDKRCDLNCTASESTDISFPGQVVPSTATATTPLPPTPPPVDPSIGPTTTEDGSVIVQPADKRRQYEKSVMIILGTVFGVIGTAIVVGVFCFWWYRRSRRRQAGNFPMQRFGHGRDSDSSIGMEHAYKQQLPMVLIVYSYDCPAHEKVVLKFAEYLSQAGNCDITLDINEQDAIQEQGIHNWYRDKLEISQYILVICSTGARFKCARNRQFRLKHDHSIPDAFAWTVDCVAEKMRMARNQGDSTDRFIIAYFDHAGESDIPPKLELAQHFVLMRDVFALYCHIHGLKSETAQHDDGATHNGLTLDTYFKTEIGKELQDTLESAKQFFKDNPDWLGQILEPVTPVVNVSKHKDLPPGLPPRNEVELVPSTNQNDHHHSRLKKQKSQSPSVTSEEDSFLEERKKRREKDKEKNIDKIPLMKARIDPQGDLADSPRTNHSQVTSNSSSVASTSPLMHGHVHSKVGGPPISNGPVVGVNGFNKMNGSQEEVELEIDDDFEEEDLDKEVDAIKNFDAHHEGEWWNVNEESHTNSRDSILDIELSGYTPPQDYVSLVSLHESLSSPSCTSQGMASQSSLSSPVRNHVPVEIPSSPYHHVQAKDTVCV